MGISSIPTSVSWAAANDLNPSMGRVTRFTPRWSCSMHKAKKLERAYALDVSISPSSHLWLVCYPRGPCGHVDPPWEPGDSRRWMYASRKALKSWDGLERWFAEGDHRLVQAHRGQLQLHHRGLAVSQSHVIPVVEPLHARPVHR